MSFERLILLLIMSLVSFESTWEMPVFVDNQQMSDPPPPTYLSRTFLLLDKKINK